MHLGGTEYVTVKNVIIKINTRNIGFINKASEIDVVYNSKEIIIASFFDTIPLQIGLYGFDILSDFISVTWFRTFDAAFSIARDMLAGSIIVKKRFTISFVF